MKTLVDTSALYALLDADDDNHADAMAWFTGPGAEASEVFVTHNYVVVESLALVQHRLGAGAVRDLVDGLLPATSTVFVDSDLHDRAMAAHLASLSRHVSFVDRVSFQLVRELRLDRAFAFDQDFANEGIPLVP